MLVPAGYQAVEYVQSNGNQYINTWISRSVCQLPIIEYIFYVDTWSRDCWLLWQWWNNWNYIFWISENQYRFTAWGTAWWSNSWISFTTWKHTFTTDSSYPYLDWTRMSWNGGNMTIYWNNANLCLFRAWWWFTVPSWNVRVYYCKISDTNWNVLREFIPCYRKSDWVIGMRDKANKVFYTNNWSWTFTKWPNV